MPYVAGKVTQNIAATLPTTGTYQYSGEVHGQVLDTSSGTPITNQKGSFTSTIDLGNRTLNSFNGNIGDKTINGTNVVAIQTTGNAVTTSPMNITVTGPGPTMNGNLNAALYGPNAENIGGDFNAKNSSGTNAVGGVFLGSRPPTQ